MVWVVGLELQVISEEGETKQKKGRKLDFDSNIQIFQRSFIFFESFNSPIVLLESTAGSDSTAPVPPLMVH